MFFSVLGATAAHSENVLLRRARHDETLTRYWQGLLGPAAARTPRVRRLRVL